MNNLSNENRGRLIIVSGPSGVGKGSIVAALLHFDPFTRCAVSATTRPPRKGDKHGSTYFFMSHEEFIDLRDRGEFMEWAEVYGNFYGTLKSEVNSLRASGYNVILEIDTKGAMNIKSQYPDAVSVFIKPPSFEELKRRIVNRGTEKPDVLQLRLSNAEREMSMAEHYDHIIINDDIELAAKRLYDIIHAPNSSI